MWLIIPILLTLHIIICLLMVAAVLMQLPRSEGLGAAFGGGMTENLFGAQTTHVLTKFTVWLGVGFFLVTLLLAMAYAHQQPSGTKFERELLSTQAPAPAVSPAPKTETQAPETSATVAEPLPPPPAEETPPPPSAKSPEEPAAP